jgi:hypothetical protein
MVIRGPPLGEGEKQPLRPWTQFDVNHGCRLFAGVESYAPPDRVSARAVSVEAPPERRHGPEVVIRRDPRTRPSRSASDPSGLRMRTKRGSAEDRQWQLASQPSLGKDASFLHEVL